VNKKQLKSVLAGVLVPLGYTCVKDTFFRRNGEVFLIVDLEKSPFGGSFDVNIGIYVDEGGELAQPPPFHQTHMIQRLPAIATQTVRNTLVPALDLETAIRDNERSATIASALEQYGLPFLNSLSTLQAIADYLSPERRNFAGVTLALREIIKRRTGREQAV
jgi:hypothetical protein